MSSVSEYFGCLVFDDRVMKATLPLKVYRSLKKTIDEDERLDSEVADAVAGAMKDWAIAHGATHFTHWFQPLTGITAEKHDSFISPAPDGGVIMEFSGKELIKGEPDASSFPSGGLRATFEARGYTAWDPTSYAFIKDRTLCIPTAFCSFGGEALDKKTPLLRSMQALNRQAMRVLRLFGNTDVHCVRTSVGPEQEYFLVDKEMYDRRKDLIFCGRTLFGAKPPKGQELDDHYFGVIKPRVAAFMAELNEELWKLGVLAKTEHNEVAPSQHELAPIFATTNMAVDQNLLIMEYMKLIADRHGMVCLLHEKPYAGVNGSGKHNNWSLTADDGTNLLDPGKTPWENTRFLLFLAAIIKAVDEYADLLRISVAYAGNDHRLGANEAPPAIISVFLGEELEGIVNALVDGTDYNRPGAATMNLGVPSVPTFRRDTTDRNRTSPFAFTGNKFEFRSLGSSQNIAMPNIVLNTAVASALRALADELESARAQGLMAVAAGRLSGEQAGLVFSDAVNRTIRETLTAHRRVIFDGNGYGSDWPAEAARRGLPNYRTAVEAFAHLTDDKNVRLFTEFGVLSPVELAARQEILFENYAKVLNIEAQTMVLMATRQIIPAVETYIDRLAGTAARKAALCGDARPDCTALERELVGRLSELNARAFRAAEALREADAAARAAGDEVAVATAFRNTVIPAMQALREPVDEMETLVSSDYWPYPSYGDLIFEV